MNQKLVFKKTEVTVQNEKTLKNVLEEAMTLQGIDLALLDKIANHLIFNVGGLMVKSLDTVVKTGQKVRLIPAVKAG